MTDRQEVRRLLEGAEIVPLTMSLVHITGDESLLRAIAAYVRGPWDHQITVPDGIASELRERMASLLVRKVQDAYASMARPANDVLLRMMSTVAGEPVPEIYLPMVQEQTLTAGRGQSGMPPEDEKVAESLRRFRVLVIGAGASGLCAAIRLGQLGIPYLILEKNPDVGGTWYENRYPGCAVDLPSHLYQYSFEPVSDWPHHYSRQPAMLRYFSMCADKYGVRPHCRFRREVNSAAYDEERRSWTVIATNPEGEAERYEANAVVCAVGQLNRPAVPDIPGLGDFTGRWFHTASWPEDGEIKGRKVALVGTAASGVQVATAIAGSVASLSIFQRSGSWVMRRPNVLREVSENTRWVLRNVPFYAAWYRFQLFWAFGDTALEAFRIDPHWSGGNDSISEVNARHRASMVRYIERELEGREDLLQKAIPHHPPYGKRVLADPGWYRTLKHPNVSLIDNPISRVEANGIRTSDGLLTEVDTIVFATGFQAGRMLWPMEVTGRHGMSIRTAWGDDNPRAYLGLVAPGFPNLFILYGPNSNFAHGGSAIFMAECQVHYVIELLKQMAIAGYSSVEVRREVHDRYNDVIDKKLQRLAWSHPSVSSWYRNGAGRIVTNQPWRLVEYWQLTRAPVMADYEVQRA